MNIKEIITNPIHDEYLDHYDDIFNNAKSVATIRELTLKKIITPNMIYNQNENICWLATPGNETINEMLIRHNAKYDGQRSIVWYGPTIVNENY